MIQVEPWRRMPKWANILRSRKGEGLIAASNFSLRIRLHLANAPKSLDVLRTRAIVPRFWLLNVICRWFLNLQLVIMAPISFKKLHKIRWVSWVFGSYPAVTYLHDILSGLLLPMIKDYCIKAWALGSGAEHCTLTESVSGNWDKSYLI